MLLEQEFVFVRSFPSAWILAPTLKKYLDDPLYMGLRQHRIGGEETTELMDEPIHETPAAFSKLLIQLEDFLTDRAFMWPAKFWSKYPLFNDATQGTGAVVLSGFTNTAKFCSTASGKPSISYRPLFFGAGFAGVRIAMQLMSFFTMQGLSEKEARERIWLVDFQGLVFDEHRPMAEHKEYFSRKDYAGPPIKDLLDILEYVKSTAFLGISTISVECLPSGGYRSHGSVESTPYHSPSLQSCQPL